ncbi:hypothetical protein [Dongshaea marina]|uniref:hypothetical protein n=1 Tax=Dongshaea marina TaxID=2047966 RepID=UPI001F4364B0|nr:hypothetical protein [Dongshaea marina]
MEFFDTTTRILTDCGLRYQAILTGMALQKMVVDEYAHSPHQKPLLLQYFESEESALGWLRSKLRQS